MAADPPTRSVPPAAAPAVAHAWSLLALSSILVFVAAALALHGLRPELDPVHSQMSLYLIGAWGPLLQAAYACLSIGMIALAVGLRRAMVPASRSAAPLLLFVLGGIALTTTAYAWMDLPGLDRTLEGLVHGVSAQAAFLCATTAMVLQAMRLRLDPHWRRAWPWLLAWALACFASVWGLALWRDAPRGLAQKAVIALMLGWLVTACLMLWRRTRVGRPRAAPDAGRMR
ncbi:DUF998 domain-containing protein [Luteimonas sp. BDR2-5]|uniref:DUF998 domain-containing protein n=1 Tax=Proluteimonas luteida TaxID=2878685 RepID=UPI001E52C995|nr:DUF998 domain-containing protein [Luteimonas sp. BDR2-5]MCD9026667.1 DUF998 domain-containing protein [Luteimonas sp. BDR2-5]